MILVDRRKGSAELLPALSKKVQSSIDTLPCGDCAFEGFTESGRALIGIERKTISDALDCMCTGRFSGLQLIEMVNTFAISYLVVEGMFRPNKDSGVMEVYIRGNWTASRKGSRTFMYADFQHFLTTLALKTPVKIWRTGTMHETVELVANLYSWHNEKAWDKHTSHLQLNNSGKPGQRMAFRKPSLRRRIACELPGIGWEKSKAIEDHFKTTFDLIVASEDDFTEIEGIGSLGAKKITKAIRSE